MLNRSKHLSLLKKALVSLSIVFLFCYLSACTFLSKNSPVKRFFVNDPALVTGTLDNGFKYILMKNKKPADRVSIHLVVRSGSMNETDEQQGLAHYLEHMLFNGTEHFPPGELVKFFQSIGMSFGGDTNAHTGFYSTVYDILLPTGNEKNLKESLVVMHDYAGSALLLESEIERERGIILAEKRDRDSASYRMSKATLKFEIGDMRITKRLPIGTEEVIKKANNRLLKSYYDTWYRPSKMSLVAVGDFDTKLAETLIKEKFSSLKPRAEKALEPPFGTIDHDGIKTFHHYEKEIGKTTVSIETVDDTPLIKDSLENRKKDLVNALANSILQNRLNVFTRKPESPFTAASASSGIYLKNIKYSDISADCSPENWKKSLGLIEQNLRSALEYGFFQEELERAKKDFIASLKRSVKSAPGRDSKVLSSKIINAITNDKRLLSPENRLKLFEPFVKTLTLEAINNAFKEIWNADHRLIVVNGNVDLSGQKQSPSRLIDQAYIKSLRTPLKKPVKEKEVLFPYLPLPAKKGIIKNRKRFKDLDITTIEFENGVKLNFKKTDFKTNQVLYKVVFGKGRQSEPEANPGLGDLSTALINESGFGRLDKEGLKRALAGKNTRLSFNAGDESFIISGSSVTDEDELMFQLIRTQLLDPGFRKEAYSLIMKKMKQAYIQLKSTVEGAEALYARSFLAGGDSRFGLPEYEVYTRNTIDHVKNWAGKAIRDAVIEISVVGDFDAESLIENCALYLGSLPAGKDQTAFLKNRRKSPEFPVGRRLELNVRTSVPKCLLKVAYQSDDFWNISRSRRLSALAAVFSEKLRNTIREELGVAYSPVAYNDSSMAYPGYGVFQAVISVKPGQGKEVAEKIKEISASLSAEKIGAGELKRAIDPILTRIKDLRKTNSYWLQSVLSGSGRHPEKFRWAKSIESDYASISSDDIFDYAKKYLNNKTSATIIITTIK